MATSDLDRFEDVILWCLTHPGKPLPEGLRERWHGGQWARKFLSKGIDYPHGPMPAMRFWPSKNWYWLEVLCRILSGFLADDAWGAVDDELESQLSGRLMDAEQWSRVYLPHMLTPIMTIERLAVEAKREYTASLARRWIAGIFRYLALMAVEVQQQNTWIRGYVGKSYSCGMGGARSLSEPPGHLDYWIGGRMLWAAIHGGNPFDVGSAYREMWGSGPGLVSTTQSWCMKALRGEPVVLWPDIPGVVAETEIWRFGKGVLVVLRTTAGLSIGSTDSIAASWTSADGSQKWLSPDDGWRNGGKPFNCRVVRQPAGLSVMCEVGGITAPSLHGLYDGREGKRCWMDVRDTGELRYRLLVGSEGVWNVVDDAGDQPEPAPPSAPAPTPPGPPEPLPVSLGERTRQEALRALQEPRAVASPADACLRVGGLIVSRVSPLMDEETRRLVDAVSTT